MMRPFLLILFLLGWSVAAAADVHASPVRQTPLDSVKVTELAAFFPDTTDVFAAVRIDSGMITTLNDLMRRVSDAMPGAFPPMGFETLLDMGLFSMLNAPFSQAVRPWLGDTLAVGMSFEHGAVIAVDIRDANAAAAFIQSLALNTEPLEWNGAPMFETSGGGGYGSAVVIQESRLIFALDVNILDNFSVVNPFSARTDFQTVFSRLPAAAYNAVAFVDMPQLLQDRLNRWGDEPLAPLWRETMQRFGALAFGLTILRDDVLTFDAVALPGLAPPPPEMPPPVYVSIANRIPADASFVLMGSDIGTTIQNIFNLMRGLDTLSRPSDQLSFSDVLLAVNFGFTGFTGLQFERDFLPHLIGNSALFFRLLPDNTQGITPNFALLTEVDSDIWNEMLNALPDTLTELNITHEVGSLGDTDFVRIPLQQNEVVFTLGVVEDYGVISAVGTSTGVEMTQSIPLYNESEFRRTLVDTLPSSQWIAYYDALPLARVLEGALERDALDIYTAENIERLLPWLSMFPRGTFSGVTTPDGVTMARFTLTVGDQPLLLRRMVAPPPGSGFAPPNSGQPATEIAPPNADAPDQTSSPPLSPPLTVEPPILTTPIVPTPNSAP